MKQYYFISFFSNFFKYLIKMYNYLYLGECDVSSIKNKIKNLDDNIWNIETIRQNKYVVHKNTKTINLLWSLESLVNSFIENKKSKEYYLFEIDIFLEKIKNLYMNKYGKGKFKRIILTKLKAKSNIDLHIDEGKSLKTCFRTHIPIITNPNVYFFVNGEQKNMKEGEIWEINNKLPHMVQNQSEFDRVHLIIDYDVNNFSLSYS